MKKNILIGIVFIIIVIGIIGRMDTHNNFKHNQPNACDHPHKIINSETSDFFATIIESSKNYHNSYSIPQKISLENRVAVVTCMDSRINISEIMGLPTEKMLIIRNAGGRVSDDVLRSITLSHKLLGVEEIFVIQHTDCGLQKITNEVMNNLLEETIFKAELVSNCNTTLEPLEDNTQCQWKNTMHCCGYRQEGKSLDFDWLPIMQGLFESIVNDVLKIRNHPLIPKNIPIYGFIFDVNTGELIPNADAMKAGRAKEIVCAE